MDYTQYTVLNGGVRMPILGFGTFMLRGNECEKCVSAAVEHGYRLIDTAEAYGNEAAVGNAVAKSGVRREQLFITTKINFRSYENARAAVFRSLKNLRSDYIDLVLLHWPFGNYYKAWRVLEKLHKDGFIRAIGVSNFDSDRLIDLISFHQIPPAVNQIETHLFCQRKSERVWMRKYGVAHQAYAPLGQGHATELLSVGEVRDIASAHGKTSAQILLRFLVQSGISVIPKSAHTDRIVENGGIFDFELTASEMAVLAALDKAAPTIGDAENPEKTELAMTW